MRLLFITQELDQNSDVLGITVPWVRALAARAALVHVLALSLGPADLPTNVTRWSMGKERGAGRWRQLAQFQRVLLSLLARRQVDAIFVHMVPRYAILAAPLARAFGVPIVLWYTHGGVSRDLRVAHQLVQRVVTASRESFRIASDKVVVTGHGIDTKAFDQAPASAASDALRLLAVGRISRVKDHETLVRAAARLRQRCPSRALRVRIAGAPLYPSDREYLQVLRNLAADEGVGDVVSFVGSVPNRQLSDEYGAADLVVSTSRTGSVDKVVLEAMACRRPAVTCNDAFAPILGREQPALLFPAGDAAALAERVEKIVALPLEERTAMGERLREVVVREHSIDSWADRTVRVLESVARGRPRSAGT